MRFTERSIKALRPKERRYEVFEDGRKGLGIRVSPSGSKSWVFVYRRNGRLSRITLGQYPDTSLAEAHDEHAERRKLLRKGTDPATVARIQRTLPYRAPTVRQLVELYIERYAKAKKRSWREDDRILCKDVLPRWGSLKAKDVTRGDVISLLDDIVDRGSPISANRTLAVVRKMFNYAVERGVVEASPCSAIRSPAVERRRDRVLDEDEIRAFWSGLDASQMSLPFRLALKLMLVTAQRRGEVVLAEKSEFDLNTGWWTIPAERSKNNLSHRVPLSSLSTELLSELMELAGDSPFLLPSPNKEQQPVLATAVNHALGRNRESLGVGRLTPHDLRRTSVSHMTSSGVSRLVVSKILNHAENNVTAVYDRHSYDQEKRKAMEAWARKLTNIVSGVADNVIPMTR